jgi:hypothetical protein
VQPFAGATEHLLALLDRLELLLRRQVLRLRAARLIADDEFRGLNIPDQQVDELLHSTRAPDAEGVASLTENLRSLEAEIGARVTPGLPLPRLEAAEMAIDEQQVIRNVFDEAFRAIEGNKLPYVNLIWSRLSKRARNVLGRDTVDLMTAGGRRIRAPTRLSRPWKPRRRHRGE